MNMNNEPIRLPALIALVVILACAVAISLLLGLELDVALATVLGVLAVIGAPVVAITESKRARTDSPATIESRLAGLNATPLPEDERDGCAHDEG